MKINFYIILVSILLLSGSYNLYSAHGDVLHTPYSSNSSTLVGEDGTLIVNDAGSGQWDVSFYRNEVVLIPLDGMMIPVEVEKQALTADNDSGSFIFQDGEIISATSSPVDSFELPSGYTFEYRPTLYVSISGFQRFIEKLAIDPTGSYGDPALSIDGKQWSDWQDIFNGRLQKEFSNGQKYQYKHFLVRWDNQKSIRKQGAALANKIKQFLKGRRDKWDVVLVGHSRGALMVNRLSKYLVGNAKIDNLHSYILDPTASVILGDQYPTSLPSQSPTKSFGTLYYDKNGLASATYGGEVIFSTDLGATWSDTDILGYKTVLMKNSTHETIHTDWINAPQNGLAQAFDTIMSKKVKGEYEPDGTLGLDIIQVSATHGTDMWGEANCGSSGCYAQGEITYDGFSVAYADASIDGSGAAMSYGLIGVVSAQYVIKKDQLLIAQEVGIAGSPYLSGTIIAGLDKRGLNASFKYAGLQAGGSVNTSDLISVDISIFGIARINGNVNDNLVDPAYNNIVKPAGDLLFDGAKSVGSAANTVGDKAYGAVKKLDPTGWF